MRAKRELVTSQKQDKSNLEKNIIWDWEKKKQYEKVSWNWEYNLYEFSYI